MDNDAFRAALDSMRKEGVYFPPSFFSSHLLPPFLPLAPPKLIYDNHMIIIAPKPRNDADGAKEKKPKPDRSKYYKKKNADDASGEGEGGSVGLKYRDRAQERRMGMGG
jgi:hypothetical protein